jgi:hypothetical protein
MLLSSFFIVDFEKSEAALDVDLPENAYICLRVSERSFNGSETINKKLLSCLKKNRFCLGIDADIAQNDFEIMIDALVSYSFFYNYLKLNFENPVFILETEKTEPSDYIDMLKLRLSDHGYKDVDILLIHKNPASINTHESNILLRLQTYDQDFTSKYINTIKEVKSANSILFFLLADSNELQAILTMINLSETMVYQQFPQTYSLLMESRKMELKRQEMLFKIGLQQEQIDSISNYHLYYNASDNRYKRQIKELISFYKNEYEILPKWYKQFGHIIKVIMGKRTFKSLFNDNVKKYKE